MYLFYIDESGSRDPAISGVNNRGEAIAKSHLYVLTAVGLFDMKWKAFFGHIAYLKRQHMDRIFKTAQKRLQLSDCEIKSNWVRIEKERKQHPFLSNLDTSQITDLTNAYYDQIAYHNMVLISVVIDKRKLHEYMDNDKLHRKAWELLCERIELFMWQQHPKHKAILICDDMTRQENLSLAMKHSYLLGAGTTSGCQLKHIVELPLFVRSELSEGIQLADLCAYNVYRVFRNEDLSYQPFQKIKESFYRSPSARSDKIDGLKIFPDDSDLLRLLK